MDQIGSALSSGFSSLSNMAPGFLGGGPGGFLSNAAGYLNPANMATGSTGPMPMDPGTGLPSTAGIPTPPSDSTFTEATAGPSGPAGSSGGMMASPFSPPAVVNPPAGTTSSGVLASLFPSVFGSGGSAPGAPAAGTAPAAGAAAPAAGARSPWASDLALLATGGTDLMKYLQQRQLENPSAIAAATQQMMNKNAAALRKAILPQVTAQGQETGQINAPYLMDQAYTSAIAPILAQEQEAAMQQWLEANRLAGGLYPTGTDVGALGGFVSPNIFGGGTNP